jgi:CDP-glycerol glycerophosphotransferase (TagB/SpsB family)
MDYYDSILVSGSDYQEKHIRKLEEVRNLPEKQVVTVGCPYLDEFEKKINNIPNEEDHVFTVLVSPTWGSSSLLSRFGEKLLDPLLKTNWKIIVRPHPQSLIVEKEMINCLSAKYAENSNLEWDFKRENIFSLLKADVMVSDTSGIIFDYVFLRDKPVFCIYEKFDIRSRDAFEIYENPEDNWNYRTLKNVGFEIKPDALDELPDQILKVSNDIDLKSVIEKTKAEAWHYKGEAGKQTANFMVSTVEAMYL